MRSGIRTINKQGELTHMNALDRYLVIDFGTSAIKAGIVDGAGLLLGVGTVDYALDTPRADWVECEVDTYWSAIKAAIDIAQFQVQSEHGAQPLAAVTFSSQGETFLCLDDAFQALRPAVVWLDNRAGSEADELSRRFGAEEIYARTGQIDSYATWPAAKLLWLKRHEPQTFARTRYFALLEDWLIARLTGELVGEVSLWSSSLMLNISDGTWWPEMLDLLDIGPERLPRIVTSGDVVGHVGDAIARELGITPGVPVVAGALDLLVAAAGAGNIAPGTVSEITGSVLGIGTCVPERPTDLSLMMPVYKHIVPGLWCVAPYSQTAGLVLRWIRDNFYGPPGQLSLDVQFEAVVAEGARVAPGSEGVMFLPHLAGAWFPEFDLSAKAAIVGLTLGSGRGHVVRAALEAVAYMLRGHVENLARIGVHPEKLISLGPSAQSLVWRQIKADVTQLPVERVTSAEAAIVGGGVLAAVGIGAHPDFASAVTEMVHPLDRTLPDASLEQVYVRQYRHYQTLFATLEPTFHFGGA